MQSMTELYILLREPVFRFLVHLTGDIDLAEELTQETFLQALLSFARFRGDASVHTWLFAIARNVYRRRMRVQTRQRSLAASGEPPSAPPDPQGMVEKNEAQAQLLEALAALPEPAHTALMLREFGGLTFTEVGTALGRSEVWARVTCFRARQRLRELYLKGTGGEQP